MKVLKIIVGILVLGIFALSLHMLYTDYEYYTLSSQRLKYSFSVSNEFYLVVISTLILAILSIPTLIYQTKQVFLTSSQRKLEDQSLIDNDDILIKTKQSSGKFLHGTTKLYAFALMTQIILLGKRSSKVLSKLDEPWHWMLLGGFALSTFVAIYFLAIDKTDN